MQSHSKQKKYTYIPTHNKASIKNKTSITNHIPQIQENSSATNQNIYTNPNPTGITNRYWLPIRNLQPTRQSTTYYCSSTTQSSKPSDGLWTIYIWNKPTRQWHQYGCGTSKWQHPQINLSGILNKTIQSETQRESPVDEGLIQLTTFIKTRGKWLKAALTIIAKASHQKVFMETCFMRNSPPRNTSLWVQL